LEYELSITKEGDIEKIKGERSRMRKRKIIEEKKEIETKTKEKKYYCFYSNPYLIGNFPLKEIKRN